MTASPGAARAAVRQADLAPVRASVEAYYTRKVETFGATPEGVDWPSTPSLELRLVQLLKACEFTPGLALNDLGCGYAAALDLIERRYPGNGIRYAGVDLSPAMIGHARRRWGHRPATHFLVGHQCAEPADYSIASGIFNVRLEHGLAVWTDHVRHSLLNLHASSRNAFAVNFMLPTPAVSRTPQLYGTPPEPWVAFCESELGRKVQVLEGYGLPEFSLVAR